MFPIRLPKFFKVPKFYRLDYIQTDNGYHVYCTIAPDRSPDLVAKLKTEEEVNSFFIDLEQAKKEPPTNRFVYHYSSQYQSTIGQMSYIDGIAQLEFKIKSMDDYRDLKKGISPEFHEKLVINSLAFIGMENDS